MVTGSGMSTHGNTRSAKCIAVFVFVLFIVCFSIFIYLFVCLLVAF